MEDGQARSIYHPDRAEMDEVDLEIAPMSDTETEARTATLGVRRKGESDSSIKRFMANWTSDSDASGDDGAESEAPARKTEGKRPRKDSHAAGTSKAPKKKLALRRSVLCSDPHLCPSASRASPWPALLHIFPELPGNFLPLHLCESCPNSFAYLLCDSQGYPISRPGCSASDPSCCSASGPSRCSGCTTHRLRYLDHSARPETSC